MSPERSNSTSLELRGTLVTVPPASKGYVRPCVTPDTPVVSSTALGKVQPFDVLQKLTAALEALKQTQAEPPLTDLSAKLMLTLHEAARLWGLSRGFLRESIRRKKLKARIIVRAWKVMRVKQEHFIGKL